MMFGWKISLEYIVMEKYYYKITLGKQKIILSEINSSNLKFSYLEVQGGDFLGYYPLSDSGGIGMTILNDKVYPGLSLYAGALVFINFNYTINRKVLDLGGKLVLPIPFKKEYRRLDPG